MEIVLYLTNNCNMNCKYCYQGDKKREYTLSFENARKAIDELSQNKNKVTIGFFGGEPLLNKELFYKVINYCEEKFKKEKTNYGFSITTNGTLIDEEFAIFCKKHKVHVGISIDGTKESHDKNRLDYQGDSTYDKTLNGLKLCIANKVKVMALPVVCLNKVDDMVNNLEFFINYGVKEVTFNFNYDDNWDDNTLEKLNEQYSIINDIYIRELKKNNRIKIYPIDTKIVFMLDKNRQCTERCNLDRTCIDSDGNFYPCVQFVGKQKYNIGNLDDGIDDKKRFELIKTRNTSSVICKDCALKRYCAYNCGCMRLVTTGDIIDVSPLVCETEKIYINSANDLIKKIGEQSEFIKYIWMKG